MCESHARNAAMRGFPARARFPAPRPRPAGSSHGAGPRTDVPRGQARGPACPPLKPALCMPYVSSGQLLTVKLQFNKTKSSYMLFLECSPQNSCFFLCAGKIAGFVCVDAARKKKQLMFTVYFITVYPTNLKAAMSFIRIIITFNAV